MYAIIEVGGKQYRVQKDDVIDIERQERQENKSIILNRVLLIGGKEDIKVGQPYIKGAKVTATLLKNIKAPKVISYKYLKRKSSHRQIGHRQLLSKLKINEIAG